MENALNILMEFAHNVLTNTSFTARFASPILRDVSNIAEKIALLVDQAIHLRMENALSGISKILESSELMTSTTFQ